MVTSVLAIARLSHAKRLRPTTTTRLVAAAASHLPQLVASALAGALTPEELSAGGNGLRDTTRIAASLSAMWRDILLDNRDGGAVVASARFEQQTVASFRAALEAGDADALESLLSDASEKRRSIDSHSDQPRHGVP